MPAQQPERKKPGLAAVHEGREQRLAGRFSRPTGRTYLIVVLGIAASIVAYKTVSGREIGSRKTALLAKQRADDATIGKEWAPLRDNLEKFVTERSGAFDADHVEPEAKAWSNHVATGIYLRIRLDDAKTPEKIRAAAQDSMKDAFVGCLLKAENQALAQGAPDAGIFPDLPWNLRQAYSATRILTPEWVAQVKDSDESIRLRIFEQQYDKAEREEIPRAIEIVKRADFFLLVLDEPADNPDDAKPRWADGGVDSAEEAVQLAPHWARIHVLDLQKNKEILRVRRRAEGQFVFAAGRPVTDEETLDAMKRQVNNCALAQQVRASIP
jgi:hypothetical protein